MKKLYRSQTEKQLAGVCGGIGEYFDTDPTLIRVAFVTVTIITGVFPGILAYFIFSLIIPTKDQVQKGSKK
jgi:phage shock protein C